jgi:phosphoenolpyruvate carboxylase
MHHPICTRHAVPASATTSLSTVLTDVQSSVVRCRTRSTGHVVKQHPPATSTHALRGQWAGTSVGRTLRSADVAHEHSVADRLCDQIVQSHDRILCKASASGYEQYRALRQAMEHTAHVLSDPRVNRATRDTARHALCAMVQSSPPDTLQFVARAFAEYQILIGEVEKFDGRRTRNEPLQTAQAIATLREHGLDLHNVLRSMRIAPVLTAHPTEIRTRDLIQVTHAFEQLLDSAAQPQVVLSGSGRQYTLPARSCVDVQALMTAVIEPLRAATLTFAEKSTVDQESIKTLSYFEDALFTSINQLCDAIDQAAGASLTTHGVHVDTWVGGDRDGNRLVTAESAAHAAARQAGVAVKHYQQALQDLAQQAPGLASACSLMSDRLAATHVELKRLAYLPEIPLMTSVDIYRNKAEVIAELQSLIDRLDGVEDQAARKAITRLQQAVHRYGFHLCSIDLRQSSHQHEVVVAELLSSHGMPGYKDLSEDQKCHVLATWISEPNARAMPPNFSDLAQYELSILQTAGRLQHVFGDDIIKNTIIAHTESPSDVLEVMALMHQTGLLRFCAVEYRASGRNCR